MNSGASARSQLASSRCGRQVPLIIRVAGLSLSSLGKLRSEVIFDQLDSGSVLKRSLDRARQKLLETLYLLVNGAPKDQRRFLLKVKRDVYNCRPLLRHSLSDFWAVVERLAGENLKSYLACEREYSMWLKDFEVLYDSAVESERLSLIGFLKNRNLVHGLSVASRSSVLYLEHSSSIASSKKQKKSEETLYRYVTRSITKLSPFSTLTRTGLAVAVPESIWPTVKLSGENWREISRSFFRLSLMEQYVDLLSTRRDSVKNALVIGLNVSLEQIEPERYIFVRPGAWVIQSLVKDAEPSMVQQQPDLVKAKLTGKLIDWLLSELDGQDLLPCDLQARINQYFSKKDLGSVWQTVERLLDIGFLTRKKPWPTDAPELDRFFLEFLEKIRDAELEELRVKLREIVMIRQNFFNCTFPAEQVERIGQLADEMWQITLALCNVEVEQNQGARESHYFYEDVFLAGGQGGQDSESNEIAQISRTKVESIVQSIQPLIKVNNLISRRHDVLATMGAAACRRWSRRSKVSFMEFLQVAAPLWQNYMSWEKDVRRKEDTGHTWNPLQLSSLNNLQVYRSKVTGAIIEKRNAACGHGYLSEGWLKELCASVPSSAADVRDYCLFAQPIDPGGEEWVINEIFEGAGRHTSRYTWVMDDKSRNFMVKHLRSNGQLVKVDGEYRELLDIQCAGSNYINCHHRLTEQILEVPGEKTSSRPRHLLRMQDLAVELRGEDVMPRLLGPKGERLAPVNLCPLLAWFMPTILKILAAFGPGTMRHMVFGQGPRLEGDLRVSDRLTLGKAVLQRKRWQFSPKALKNLLGRSADHRAFIKINDWRRSVGIPSRVFYSEPTGHKVKPFKPQYIDFESATAVRLFRSSLDEKFQWLGFEEVLPDFDQLRSWGLDYAIELQLDSLMLGQEN